MNRFPALAALILIVASIARPAPSDARSLPSSQEILAAALGLPATDLEGDLDPLLTNEDGTPVDDGSGRYIALPDGEARVADAVLSLGVTAGLVQLAEPINRGAPAVDAGPDRDVDTGEAVVLNGEATDPEGEAVTYLWSQVSGPAVDLGATDGPTLNFQAPPVAPESEPERLLLRLTASDGAREGSDEVEVVVRPLTGPNSRPRPPVPDAGADQTVDEGDPVTLDGSGTTDPNDDALTYDWRQVGGPAATLSDTAAVSPTFVAPDVTADATLVFELGVSDLEFLDETDQVTVTVRFVNQPPVADAGPDLTVQEGTVVTLDASASSDPDGQSLTVLWSQTAGPDVTLSDRTAVAPTFTAPDLSVDTDLEFEVAVSDGAAISTDRVLVTVRFVNQAPVADAGPDQSVDEGAAVVLDGSASADPDGQTLAYAWTQRSGPPVTLSGADGPSPTFTAPDVTADATIVLDLAVSDGSLETTDSVSVSVRFVNQSPVADAGPDQTVQEGTLVTLDASGSSDPDGQSFTVLWSQTAGPAITLSDRTAVAPTFTAPDLSVDAELEFEVVVSDGAAISADRVLVTVRFDNDAPIADAGPDVAVDEGSRVTLDASASSDANAQALSFSWAQIDGPPVVDPTDIATATPSFTAPDVTADAVLTIAVTVSDGELETTDEVLVTVRFVNQAPVADAGPDQSVDESAAVVLDGSASADPDGQTLTYAWTQRSGPPVALSGADGPSPTFTAPDVTADATIVFDLAVSDGSVETTDSVSVAVRFVNQPPAADAGGSKSANAESLVVLDGSGSADPDGQALAFAWTQTAGPLVVLSDTAAAAPTFTAPDVSADTTLKFTLTVSDGEFDASDEAAVTVLFVNAPPAADAGPDQIVTSGTIVQLDGTGSTDPDGDPLGYVWTQVSGPGVTILDATTATPRFVAPAVEVDTTLRFQLAVSDGAVEATDTVDVVVDWINTAPIANAGADRIVGIGDAVVLQGGASFDPDGQPITYAWTQVGGWPAGTLKDHTTSAAGFTAPFVIGDQWLTFRLTVSDGETTSWDEVRIKVLFINLPPIAAAGPDQTVDERTAVQLDGTGSVDIQGQTITYAWSQSAGPAVTLSGADTPTPSFPGIEVAQDETLTFTLTVSDGTSNASDSVNVTILNVSEPPAADAGPDQSVEGGATVQLDGSGTTDPDGDPLAFAWVQTAGTAVTLDDPASETPTFTAPSPSTDEILSFELTVDDGLYQSVDAVDITVLGNVAPVANAGADQSLPEGSLVTLDGTASADADGDSLSYAWAQVSGPTVALSGAETSQPTFTLPNVVADTPLVFSLVVGDGTLTSESDEVTITALFVNQPPVANAGGDQSVVPGGTATLDASLSADPDGQPLSFSWTQLSGPAAALDDPALVRPTFTVPSVSEDTPLVFEVTVSDGGLSDQDTVTVTASVSNIPPTADAGADQSADEQTAITLDGGASFDPEGAALAYLWEQVAGPAAAIDAPTAAQTTVALPDVNADATLVFRLTVDDGTFSGSDEVSVVARLVNQAPVADAGADHDANEGTLVTLNGSGSSDPEGQAIAYAWTQTAGPAVTLSSASAPNPTFTAPDVAADTPLTFQLTVTDDQTPALSASDEVTVTVRFVNRAPVADAGADQTVAPEALVVLDGSASTDPDGETIAYAWTQTSGDPVSLTGADTPAPSFTAMETLYDKILVFQLAVSDGTASHSDSVQVRVDYPNVAPVASAGPDQTVTEGDSVTLDGTASSDADGHPLTFQWLQTQGPKVTILAPSGSQAGFTAPQVNEDTDFVFQVTVHDGELLAYDQVKITVKNVNQTPVADAGLDQTVAEGAGVLLTAAASHDPDGAALTYSWTQTSGPTVALTGADAVEAVFTAPAVTAPTALVFAVHVSDGELIDDDSVTITIEPANGAPTADAGPDQTVAEGATVALDGTASADPDGDSLAFAWTQVFGPPVTLSDPVAAQPTFTAPQVTQDLALEFRLLVDDGAASAVDTVRVTVTNAAGTTIYVDAANTSGTEDGSQTSPWSTIAEALAAAADGDAIEVAAGTYTDALTIHKSVAIRAPAGPSAVSVQSGVATVVDSVSQATIEGIAFSASATDGLRVLASEYVTISNCVFEGNAHNGLYAADAFGLTLLDSVFRSNGADGAAESNGALVVDSDYLTVRGGAFESNGLTDTHVPPASVTAVTDVHGNGLAVEGASQIEIEASAFTGNRWVGLFVNQGAGNAVAALRAVAASGNEGAGVVLANATTVSVEDSTVESNGPASGAPDGLFGGHGVGMVGVAGVTFSGANAVRANRGSGIVWGLGEFSDGVTIDGATIADNDEMGVAFDFSSNVLITGATITGNASFGVGMRSSSSVEITASTIDLNGASGVGAINSNYAIEIHDNASIGSNAAWGIECSVAAAPVCSTNNIASNTSGAIVGCGTACVD